MSLDGRRLAELLASELTARADGPLAGLELVDVDRDVEPTEDGALGYRIARDDRVLADCHVAPDRILLAFRAGLDLFPACSADRGLRTRPKAVDPPRVLVFVEDGSEVKRVLPVVAAVADADDA